jgi:hypothetical protein
MDIIYQSQAMNESVQFGWPEDYCDPLRFERKNKGALCAKSGNPVSSFSQRLPLQRASAPWAALG